jgi:hypothetical protein
LRETCSFKMARIAGTSAEEIFPDEINLESSSFASSREWDVFGVVVAVFGASACDMLWEVGKLAKDPVVGGDAQPVVVEQCKIESLDTCDRGNRSNKTNERTNKQTNERTHLVVLTTESTNWLNSWILRPEASTVSVNSDDGVSTINTVARSRM